MSKKNKLRIPTNPLGSLKKIFKRGLYEMIWGAKPRDYGKRVGIKQDK